ncbi:MAG: Gfo/Idh/MocA family protein [Alphaproteobacteria bacterium]
MRILQVGYGAFGARHAEAWASRGLEASLAICDAAPDARARAAAAHPCARVVEDWRAELGTGAVVDVVAPTDANAGIALACLEAGHDVFVEKPAGRDAAEAARLRDCAAARGCLVQVGFVLRFHPLAARLKALVGSGALGQLRWIGADFLSLKRPRRDAGVVLNDAVHFLDLLLWIKGDAPRGVLAAMRDGLGRGFEDLACAILDWDDGALARLDASCVVAGEEPDAFAPPGAWSRKRLEFAGVDGRAIADFSTGELAFRAARQERDGDGWRQATGPWRRESHVGAAVTPMLAAGFASFLASRAARTPPDPGIGAGIAVAAACEAIFAAAREGRRIEVRVP